MSTADKDEPDKQKCGKKCLRDGAERANEKLWRLCGAVLDLFTETECRNFFKRCGYCFTWTKNALAAKQKN